MTKKKNRKDKRLRCSMYIKNNIILSPCPKPSILHEKMFESLFINVHFEGRSLTCGTIYRPTRSDTAGLTCFFEDIDLIFKELNKTKTNIFLWMTSI